MARGVYRRARFFPILVLIVIIAAYTVGKDQAQRDNQRDQAAAGAQEKG